MIELPYDAVIDYLDALDEAYDKAHELGQVEASYVLFRASAIAHRAWGQCVLDTGDDEAPLDAMATARLEIRLAREQLAAIGAGEALGARVGWATALSGLHTVIEYASGLKEAGQ